MGVVCVSRHGFRSGGIQYPRQNWVNLQHWENIQKAPHLHIERFRHGDHHRRVVAGTARPSVERPGAGAGGVAESLGVMERESY